QGGVVSVGAQRADGTTDDTGATYTFVPDQNGNYVGYDGTVYSGVPADGSASNPVNSDNLAPAKLTASDGGTTDLFGLNSVVNDNGVVLAGAHGDDDKGNASGSAYLYTPDGNGGYTQLKLSASDLGATSAFGYSVALNNAGVAVAGAFNNNAVYVFRPDGNGDYFEAKLMPSDGISGDLFGWSSAINESGVIAVGAHGDDDYATNSGSVYVYSPDGFGGYDEVKLTASDRAANNNFGKFVTISDAGQVVVGAPYGDDATLDTGAVYVFTPDGNGGYTEVKLTASDGVASDFFGHSAAVNAAGTVVVGAYGDEDGAVTNSGSVYVYQPDGNGGYTETKLSALDKFAGDVFGSAVSINDNGTIVVGAHGNDDAGSTSGSAYVFVPDGNGGYTQYKLTAPDGEASDAFGISVSVSQGGVVSVGAQRADGTTDDTGATYTFVPDQNGNYVGYDGTVYSGTTSAGLNVLGTDTDNALSGGASDDLIEGLAGNDVLTGNGGDDTLTGGTGSDTFVFKAGDTGHDTVTDFAAGAGSDDILSFETTLFADFASVLAAATDVGSNIVITIDASTSIELQGVSTANLHEDDFQFV
ncbi:MAG: hypothetical protein K5905_08065, partial [Roseibium sp.]|nr:hypothetical protein [Roseibium sp.]